MRVRLVDVTRAEVGEDVRVGVGAVECQLYATDRAEVLSRWRAVKRTWHDQAD